MRFSIAIVLLVAGYTWIVEPVAGRAWASAIAVAVIGLGVWHAARRGDWGWSTPAFVPALAASALLTGLAAAGLVLVSRAVAGEHVEPLSASVSSPELGWLLVWGGAQQWLLQTTFLREAELVWSGRRAPLVAAALFGALHLPNPVLTAVTFGAGLAWCTIYSRWPNVLPLALSHAVGTVLLHALPGDVLTGGLRVGSAYWRS